VTAAAPYTEAEVDAAQGIASPGEQRGERASSRAGSTPAPRATHGDGSTSQGSRDVEEAHQEAGAHRTLSTEQDEQAASDRCEEAVQVSREVEVVDDGTCCRNHNPQGRTPEQVEIEQRKPAWGCLCIVAFWAVVWMLT